MCRLEHSTENITRFGSSSLSLCCLRLHSKSGITNNNTVIDMTKNSANVRIEFYQMETQLQVNGNTSVVDLPKANL